MVDFDKVLTNGRKYITLMPFGSRLYGTSSPESDSDYKGVFFPLEKKFYSLKSLNHKVIKKKE